MTRPLLLAVLLSASTSFALAQTAEDLKNDAKTPDSVLVYGMGYAGQRYSPLTQINKQNVGKMVPAWSYSMGDLYGAEGFPIIKDGVVYVTTHNATAALDAVTGKPIWRVVHEYPPEALRVVCCGIVNRGAAIYQGMIIRALIDDRLTALDAKTGKEIWTVKSPDPVTSANGYAMTGEFQALDAENGKVLWSFQTPSGIVGQPVTWQKDGKQYVTVLSGLGGVYARRSGDPNLEKVPYGASLWTFALFDK